MAAMKIVVKSKNLDITPALRTYAEKKISKFEKFITAASGDHESLAVMMLRTEREVHIAELTIEYRGFVLRGEGRTDDMYNSIDDAVDKLNVSGINLKLAFKENCRTKISELASPADDGLVQRSIGTGV